MNFYRAKADHALAKFQLLEQTIKDYLDAYYSTISLFLPSNLTYSHSRSDIENESLDSLVYHFSKTIKNEDLIERVSLMLTKRNKLAHKALLSTFKKNIHKNEYESSVLEYISIADELHLLIANVLDESKNIKAALATLA